MHADDEDRITQSAESSSILKKILLLIIVAALAGGAYYYFQLQRDQGSTAVVADKAADSAAPTVAAATRETQDLPYPVLDAIENAQSVSPKPSFNLPQTLPAVDESDAPLLQQLNAGLSNTSLLDRAALNDLARKFVAFTYALAAGDVDYRALPLLPLKSSFSVIGSKETLRLNPASYERYDAYAQAFSHLDVERSIAVYRFFWPLFNELFTQYGEPNKNLHSELLQAVKLLQDTPTLAEPPRLIRQTVYYQFADPKLEALPGAQRQLMRMGPENTRLIKEKLRELSLALDAITEFRSAP